LLGHPSPPASSGFRGLFGIVAMSLPVVRIVMAAESGSLVTITAAGEDCATANP
jgi:hypothetical protein